MGVSNRSGSDLWKILNEATERTKDREFLGNGGLPLLRAIREAADSLGIPRVTDEVTTFFEEINVSPAKPQSKPIKKAIKPKPILDAFDEKHKATMAKLQADLQAAAAKAISHIDKTIVRPPKAPEPEDDASKRFRLIELS